MATRPLTALTLLALLASPAHAKERAVKDLGEKTFAAFVTDQPPAIVLFRETYSDESKAAAKMFETYCTGKTTIRCGSVDVDKNAAIASGQKAMIGTPLVLFYNRDVKAIDRLDKPLAPDEIDAKVARLYK